MPMLIKDFNKLENDVSFTYNLFFEMILFWVLLADPNNFSHEEWANEESKKIPKDFLEIISFWASFESGFFFLDIITKNALLPLKHSSTFLNYIEEMSYETFLNSLWEKPGAWEEEDECKYRLFDSTNYDKLLASPQKLIDELKSFFSTFYYDHFQAYSQTIELALIQDINTKIKSLTKDGLEKFFLSFSRKHSMENGTLVIEGWPDKTFEAGKDVKELVLIPQIFSAPHYLFDYKSFQDTLYIAYPLKYSPFLEKSDISQEEIEYFTGAFRVLGEPVRMKILMSLYKKPSCNQDLAVEMNLSRPTISKHISRLRLYNFIKGKEIDGNRIEYSISSNRIIDLLKKMGLFSQ